MVAGARNVTSKASRLSSRDNFGYALWRRNGKKLNFYLKR